MRAGIYARISDDREETQAGVGRQLDDCREGCDRRGWEIVDEYVDNDLSAYKRGVRRPEYERMLEDIAARRITAIIVYHQDRLWRQPRELEDFFDVCDAAGLRDMASVTGDTDLSTDDGRMKLRILAAVARNQSDAQSRRIRRKAQSLALEGKVSGGGSRPFGFEADRVTVRESEAVVIRDLAERLLAGETLRSLAVDLNRRGIRTPSNEHRPDGGEWVPSPTLRRLLRSARISGQREHKGEIVADAVWPAIITPEQTRRIRALLDDPSRRATRAPQKYLLNGVLRCGLCRAALVARPREDGKRRYVCAKDPGFHGCGGTFVLGPPIEEFVTEAVLLRLTSPAFAERRRGLKTRPDDGLSAEIDDLTARLDDLASAYADRLVTMREWIVARAPLTERLDAARRREARRSASSVLDQFTGDTVELRDRWPEIPFDRQHAILKAMLVEVLARPAVRGLNRFDPRRFDLNWR